MKKIFLLLALSGLFAPAFAQKKVIFDSDMGPDYDDVGALAVLHALADNHEAEILATVASNRYELVVPCLRIINTYFKRPGIPVGKTVDTAPLKPCWQRGWTDTLVARYPQGTKTPPEDAVSLYRRMLARQKDNSVTIITVGFLSNLKALLESGPDRFSPLNGTDLVKKKVAEWVCMGGAFGKLHQKEFNLVEDAAASKYVLAHFPRPALFSGFEIGIRVKTGVELTAAHRAGSPVEDTFRIAMKSSDQDKDGRPSWDQTAVLVGVRGFDAHYTVRRGRAFMEEGGINGWTDQPDGPHAYLVEKSSPGEVRREIEGLMKRLPRK